VDIPDAFLFYFAAPVLIPTFQEATDDAEQHPLDEDEDEDGLSVQLYPRKPELKPGPKPTADLSRKFPPPATHPTRQNESAFKLGVLSYAIYGRIDDGKGGLRAPLAREVCERYNPKHTRYLRRWSQEEETF